MSCLSSDCQGITAVSRIWVTAIPVPAQHPAVVASCSWAPRQSALTNRLNLPCVVLDPDIKSCSFSSKLWVTVCLSEHRMD